MISEAQNAAIKHKDGPMMVLAGPGSGKTFVITRRIRYMINEYHIAPESILVITFTKNSAVEMKERFESLMEGEYAPVNFGTFHAIYFNIIKSVYHYDISNIISEKEKRLFMKRVLESIKKENTDISDNLIPSLISDISKIKNDGNNITDCSVSYLDDDIFHNIFADYSQMMRDMDKVDFDDMVLICKELFEKNESVLEKWRDRYKYILIDEFQDINTMQYDVIKMLSYPCNNLFVVGDDDQAIYGFRGSCPSIMLNFCSEYKNAKKVLLDTNYRCNNDIVEKSVSFIENNKNRFFKDIKANKISNKKISLKAYDSRKEENAEIVKIINTSKRFMIYSDIAIIYRTNKAAVMLTQLLSEEKIPFMFKEKPSSIFNHYICQDIISIISFAKGNHNRKDFIRFMNKPLRYIPRNIIQNNVDIDELIKLSIDKKYLYNNLLRLKYDLNKIKNMTLFEGLNYIRKAMLYEDFVIKEALKRKQDINEIKEIFTILQDVFRNISSLNDFYEYIELYDENLNKAAVNSNEDRVNIMTMHGSKGLEFRTVILPDLNEGIIPGSKIKTKEEIEEERRVFYVAMTRAKDNLFLMYLKKNSENRFNKSRFLDEIKGINSQSTCD